MGVDIHILGLNFKIEFVKASNILMLINYNRQLPSLVLIMYHLLQGRTKKPLETSLFHRIKEKIVETLLIEI